MSRMRDPIRRAAVAALVAGLAVLVVLGLTACGEEDSPTGVPSQPGPFELGETTSVVLDLPAGAVYADIEDSLDFVFPSGADGRLTRGELLSAPSRGREGGRGFYVTYGGEDAVQLRVPLAEGDLVYLLGYGMPFGSRNVVTRESWFALPVADTLHTPAGDSLLIWLGQPAPASGGACETSSAYWLFDLSAGSADATAFATAVAQARAFLSAWLDSLDEPERSACRLRIETQLPPHFYPDGDYYCGFTRLCPAGDAVPDARVGLLPGADAQAIAHEIGHYCTHLLAGDQAYRLLEAHVPADKGIGAYQWREGLIEDYAHYHELLLTGAIAGAGDPASPAGFFPRSLDPAQTDLPSFEGYGTLLLAALSRREAGMISLRGDSVQVPALGLDYGEVASGILSQAPYRIVDLYGVIDGYLEGIGRDGCLPPLAAATGWCYNGGGQISDGSAYVVGASVWNYVEAQGRRYDGASAAAVSGYNGGFSLGALFPGRNILRVEVPADTFEFPLDCPLSTYTNQTRALGARAPWISLDHLTKAAIDNLRLRFAPMAEETTGVSISLYNQGITATGLVFEPERVHLSAPFSLPMSSWVLDTLDLRYSTADGRIELLKMRLRRQTSSPATLAIDGRVPLQAIQELSACTASAVYFADLPGVDGERMAGDFAVAFTDSLGTRTESDLEGTQYFVMRVYRG